jgi:hypothetical protein
LNGANVYYVDNQNGSDNNDGKSVNTPWKTTGQINSIVFQPGDKILFKRDQLFPGDLHLKGNGTESLPVMVSSYGAGKRPVISAVGKRYAVMLMNAENYIISDLEATGATEAGIFAGCSSDNLELKNIRVFNCFVHDIGDSSKVSWDLSTVTGGIIIVNGSLNDKGEPVFYNSTINNVTIEDCSVFYNYRWTCISITSGRINGIAGNGNRIRNCTVAYSSADGIRMNGVKDSFIEYCVLYRNGAWPNPEGHNLGGLGAWFFDAENCTIQYCEAGWVRTTVSDGGAFDIDYRQKNSTVQYCYGHHCASYGVSVFGAESTNPTLNSTIRYNIFSSNAMDKKFGVQGEYFVFTWSGGLLNGVKIHDNVSYWDPVVPAPAHNFNADFTGNNPNTFTRNTIITKHPWLAFHKNDTMKSDSNVFVSSGTPVYWKMRKDSFENLASWQSVSGMDRNSTFVRQDSGYNGWARRDIPEWYKLNVPAVNVSIENRNGPEPGDRIDINAFTKKESDGQPLIIFFTGMHQSNNSGDYLPVRVQMNYLNSMIRQYGPLGIRLLVIDVSGSSKVSYTSEELKNFQRDNSFSDQQWIEDNDKLNYAVKFGVSSLPATLLVAADGTVISKWNGVVLPAELAFAIEEALGM